MLKDFEENNTIEYYEEDNLYTVKVSLGIQGFIGDLPEHEATTSTLGKPRCHLCGKKGIELFHEKSSICIPTLDENRRNYTFRILGNNNITKKITQKTGFYPSLLSV